jgi:RHS repeat-associated protein
LGNTVLSNNTWSYDAASRVKQFILLDGSSAYSYDNTDQLAASNHSYQTDEAYSYDANGNRRHVYLHLRHEGNRIQRSRTGKIITYTWDHRNRLTRVEFRATAGGAVTKSASYVYDPLDRRIVKTVDPDGAGPNPATIERYIYDRDHIWLCFDGNNTLTNRYLYGPALDMALADERSPTTVRWMLTDNQGTVRDITNNVGAVQNHIRYDSFGRITSQTNANFSTRFNYTGREFDAETGLYFYRSRYYDPGVGRFIGEDAIGFAGGDANLYRYVGNSPVNFVDPFGLLTIVIPGGFGEVGTLPQNIINQAKYSVITIGNLGRPGPDFEGKKLRKILSQIAPFINRGLLPNEPIVIIAHSDGNQLIQKLIDFIRSLQGIPGRSGKGFGKPDKCINPQTIQIQVGRLDPTFIRKPARANQVIDVGSNIPDASILNVFQWREWASNNRLRPDFRAPLGTTHDGLLNERSIISTLRQRYKFDF